MLKRHTKIFAKLFIIFLQLLYSNISIDKMRPLKLSLSLECRIFLYSDFFTRVYTCYGDLAIFSDWLSFSLPLRFSSLLLSSPSPVSMEGILNNQSQNSDLLDHTINDPLSQKLNTPTLVGKLITHKTINARAIIATLSSSWNLGSNINITMLDTTIIACSFTHRQDYDRVKDNGLCTVKATACNLKPWSQNIPLKEVNFSKCAFWVQVHHLPPNRMNMDNAVKIGNHLGTFYKTDSTILTNQIRGFICVREFIDTSKPRKSGFFISRENGQKLWIAYKYERLADFYYKCGKLDHTERACLDDSPTIPLETNESTYLGPWLRATSTNNKIDKQETTSIGKSENKYESHCKNNSPSEHANLGSEVDSTPSTENRGKVILPSSILFQHCFDGQKDHHVEVNVPLFQDISNIMSHHRPILPRSTFLCPPPNHDKPLLHLHPNLTKP